MSLNNIINLWYKLCTLTNTFLLFKTSFARLENNLCMYVRVCIYLFIYVCNLIGTSFEPSDFHIIFSYWCYRPIYVWISYHRFIFIVHPPPKKKKIPIATMANAKMRFPWAPKDPSCVFSSLRISSFGFCYCFDGSCNCSCNCWLATGYGHENLKSHIHMRVTLCIWFADVDVACFPFSQFPLFSLRYYLQF